MRGFGSACAVLAVLLTSIPAGADVVPQRTWRQIQSAHFRVIGDVSPRALRQVAERMEQLHELLTMLAPDTDERALDTTVLAFRDAAAFRPFMPVWNGAVQEVGGYFQPGAMNYITLAMSQESAQQSVVFHEYVHLVLNRLMGDVAPWIGEGLAEFYSTFEVTGGGKTARLGGMLQHHLWTLQQVMVPLETLTRVTHASPLYNEREKSTVFYAQSWALVHYLQLGNNRKYAKAFGPLVEALRRGTPFGDACKNELGVTSAVLEEELKRYAFAPVLYRADVALPARLSRIERLEPTPVPEADTHAILGDLLTRLDRAADGRAHLDHALAVDPQQALALAALAQIEAEAGRSAPARTFATRPASVATYQSEFYRAEALAGITTDQATLAPLVEAALRQAIALNPGFAPAYHLLSRRLGESPATRDEALRLVRTAIRLAPVRDDYRLQLARLQLLADDLPAARAVLGPLAARGSSEAIKKAARDYLGYSARLSAAAAEELERATQAGAPPAVPDPEPQAPGVGEPSAPSTPASGGSEPAPARIPKLRTVASGEVRVFGTWAAIECGPGPSVVLVAGVSGKELRVRAEGLDRVTFVSYRSDRPGSVGCGPQSPLPVLVTYRPGAAATANGVAGVAVAVEFMPAGYQP